MKIKSYYDFKIEVTPTEEYNPNYAYDEAYKERMLKHMRTIIADIKRHVDYVADCNIDFTVVESCSHCGYTWEVDDDGTPVCCDKAIQEHSASKAVQE